MEDVRLPILVFGWAFTPDDLRDPKRMSAAAAAAAVEDLRLAKAAALYGSHVVVSSTGVNSVVTGLSHQALDDETRQAVVGLINAYAPDEIAHTMTGSIRSGPARVLSRAEADVIALARVPHGAGVRLAGTNGVGRLQNALLGDELRPEVIPVFTERTYRAISATLDWLRQLDTMREDPLGGLDLATSTSYQRHDGNLPAALISSLPAFPSADWDVILDVRERLAPARLRFLAAMSLAASKLAADPRSSQAAYVDVQRRVMNPALLDIEERLTRLGVVPTLLRLSRDSPTVLATAANLIVSFGAGELSPQASTAHAVASAPVVASAAKELLLQRETRRSVSARPYWFLREIDRRLAKAS